MKSPDKINVSKRVVKRCVTPRKVPTASSTVEQSQKKLIVEGKKHKKKDKKDNKDISREEVSNYKKKTKPEDEEDVKVREIPVYMKADNKTPEQKAGFEKVVRGLLEKGVDNLLKEYMDQLRPYVNKDHKREVFDANHSRNRYKDVICNDVTRVVLNDGKGQDYIHANHVRGDPLFNEFICTQGVMPGTAVDFWRMIVLYKIEHIIMLCEVVEAGKTKCEPYWPTVSGQKLTFGDMVVTALSVQTKDSHITKTHLEVEVNGGKLVVRHHHWKTWPDRHVPKSVLAVLRVLQATRGSSTPIVVHCSAGIGRTGTLVAVEMCLQSILGKHQLNLLETCKRLKDQRMQSIQVDIQYVYIAQVMIECGKALGYWNAPDIAEEYAKFKAHFDEVLKTRTTEDWKPMPVSHSPFARTDKGLPQAELCAAACISTPTPSPIAVVAPTFELSVAPPYAPMPGEPPAPVALHPALSPHFRRAASPMEEKTQTPPPPPPPPAITAPANNNSVWMQ